MWGVPINTLSSNSRLISGSCSHTSMMASKMIRLSRAFKRALVSMTSPREVLMITGFRLSDWKKFSSARWKVLYFPSLYKGTWKVMISHSSAILLSEANCSVPSFSSRGKSFSKTRMPKSRATLATLLPTFPTPMIPIVSSFNFLFLQDFHTRSDDCIYWATEAELHPGAFVHSIPACLQYSVSMWSKPMVAVAMNFTRLPSNKSRLQCVRVRTMSASASRTSSGVKSFPGT